MWSKAKCRRRERREMGLAGWPLRIRGQAEGGRDFKTVGCWAVVVLWYMILFLVPNLQ